ncbi:MAG: 30S ribosomal protein S27e [Candidatus Heimdallarchaeota archaeon]
MKEKRIPTTRSNFLKVSCECGNVQEIFSHATSQVECRVCGNILAKPRAGMAYIIGEVLEVIDPR